MKLEVIKTLASSEDLMLLMCDCMLCFLFARLCLCAFYSYGYVPTEEEVANGMVNPYDAEMSQCDGAYAGKLYRCRAMGKAQCALTVT